MTTAEVSNLQTDTRNVGDSNKRVDGKYLIRTIVVPVIIIVLGLLIVSSYNRPGGNKDIWLDTLSLILLLIFIPAAGKAIKDRKLIPFLAYALISLIVLFFLFALSLD